MARHGTRFHKAFNRGTGVIVHSHEGKEGEKKKKKEAVTSRKSVPSLLGPRGRNQ